MQKLDVYCLDVWIGLSKVQLKEQVAVSSYCGCLTLSRACQKLSFFVPDSFPNKFSKKSQRHLTNFPTLAMAKMKHESYAAFKKSYQSSFELLLNLVGLVACADLDPEWIRWEQKSMPEACMVQLKLSLDFHGLCPGMEELERFQAETTEAVLTGDLQDAREVRKRVQESKEAMSKELVNEHSAILEQVFLYGKRVQESKSKCRKMC